jgi:hypothetical protein
MRIAITGRHRIGQSREKRPDWDAWVYRFSTLAVMETQPTNSAQNRVRLLKIELAAHSKELRILGEDGRYFTEADRQHHRAMVRYFRSEIEAIRSQAPLSLHAAAGTWPVSADEDSFMT